MYVTAITQTYKLYPLLCRKIEATGEVLSLRTFLNKKINMGNPIILMFRKKNTTEAIKIQRLCAERWLSPFW